MEPQKTNERYLDALASLDVTTRLEDLESLALASAELIRVPGGIQICSFAGGQAGVVEEECLETVLPLPERDPAPSRNHRIKGE